MSTESANNNKRIAKNTLLLYVRMLFSMVVSLFTSRVILNTLGVEDFGIYNVVGGIVVMFTTITGSLSTAISRFFTFELGRGNNDKLNSIFSCGVTIQIFIALIIALLAELVGIWFLNVKMDIPDTRLYAANWVFQLSIITFGVNLISIPYNAAIVAHEKMSAFAYISILEALGKLVIAFLIIKTSYDRLIVYSVLMCLVALLVRYAYGYYCGKHFPECKYRFVIDKRLLNEMFKFAGWNFIGAASGVLRDTGGNILINLFAGPVVNAARGIANQVNTAVFGFAANFMTAINPQITKSYANGDHKYLMSLLFKGARLSFYLLLILSLPILLNTNMILTVWLKVVPEHTVLFVRLILIFAMLESISYPLITAMLATGNIKKYQIIVGGVQMLNLPISYVLLRFGAMPETVVIVAIILGQVCLAFRLVLLRTMINLSATEFLNKVYFNLLKVSVISLILPLTLHLVMKENLLTAMIGCMIAVISSLLTVLYIGCDHVERELICVKVKSYLNSKRKK